MISSKHTLSSLSSISQLAIHILAGPVSSIFILRFVSMRGLIRSVRNRVMLTKALLPLSNADFKCVLVFCACASVTLEFEQEAADQLFPHGSPLIRWVSLG